METKHATESVQSSLPAPPLHSSDKSEATESGDEWFAALPEMKFFSPDLDGFGGKSDSRFLRIYEQSVRDLDYLRTRKIGQFIEHKAEVVPSFLPDPQLGPNYKHLFAFGKYQTVNVHMMCAIVDLIALLNEQALIRGRHAQDEDTSSSRIIYNAKRVLYFSTLQWNDEQDKEAAKNYTLKRRHKTKGVLSFSGATEEEILHVNEHPTLTLQLHLYILRFLVAHLVEVPEPETTSPFKEAPLRQSVKRKLEETKAGAAKSTPPAMNSRRAAYMYHQWPKLEAKLWKVWFDLLPDHHRMAWMVTRNVVTEDRTVCDKDWFLCLPQYAPGSPLRRTMVKGMVQVHLHELSRVGARFMECAIRRDIMLMTQTMRPFPRLLAKAALEQTYNVLTVASRVELVSLKMIKCLLLNKKLMTKGQLLDRELNGEITLENLQALDVLPACQRAMHLRFQQHPSGPKRLDHDGRVYMFNFMSAMRVPMAEALEYASAHYARDEDIGKTVKSIYVSNRPGMSCAKMANAGLCPFTKGGPNKVNVLPDIEEVATVAQGCSKCSEELDAKFPAVVAPFNYSVNSAAAYTQTALRRMAAKRYMEVRQEPEQENMQPDVFSDEPVVAAPSTVGQVEDAGQVSEASVVEIDYDVENSDAESNGNYSECFNSSDAWSRDDLESV